MIGRIIGIHVLAQKALGCQFSVALAESYLKGGRTVNDDYHHHPSNVDMHNLIVEYLDREVIW